MAVLSDQYGFPGSSAVKNSPAMWETWIWSLGQEGPPEKGMATHSSIFAWGIPWTEEPGGLQSLGLPKSQTLLSNWEHLYMYVCVCVCVCACVDIHMAESIKHGRQIVNVVFPGILLFSCSVVSNSLRPHGLQHTRPPCLSPSPGICSNWSSLNWWCHPTISSSEVTFSSCLQSFPVYWGLKKSSTGSHSQFYKLVCAAQGSTGITAANSSSRDNPLQLAHSKCHLLRGVHPDTALQEPVLRWILAYLYRRTFCGQNNSIFI